jgi:non-specific serine/threonine protein kinase
VGACQGLDGAAATAVALGRPEAAVRLFAATDALRQRVGAASVSPYLVEREGHVRALAAAREALGPERCAAAAAAGAALSLQEAVAEALALSVLDPAGADSRLPSSALRLTAREREVLREMVGGLSDKEIAAAMGITRRTASNHVAAILAKLGAPSRTAATTIAIRDHLV